MAEQTREIPREEWSGYFDAFSRDLPDLVATVEVLGDEIGAEIETERSRLTALTYDGKDDILVIGLDSADDAVAEDVEHIVYGPRRIAVAEKDGETDFEIEDGEGTRTVLRLRHAS
jgi:hypothetical protein